MALACERRRCCSIPHRLSPAEYRLKCTGMDGTSIQAMEMLLRLTLLLTGIISLFAYDSAWYHHGNDGDLHYVQLASHWQGIDLGMRRYMIPAYKRRRRSFVPPRLSLARIGFRDTSVCGTGTRAIEILLPLSLKFTGKIYILVSGHVWFQLEKQSRPNCSSISMERYDMPKPLARP